MFPKPARFHAMLVRKYFIHTYIYISMCMADKKWVCLNSTSTEEEQLSLSPSGLRAPFFKRFRPVGGAINNVAIAVEAVPRAEK